jgi:1,4-alpha-glucan branching enzyme
MTPGKPLFGQLQHRDATVREAALQHLLATVERHGGDARAAARELGVSLRTVRKWLATAAERPAARAQPEATTPASTALSAAPPTEPSADAAAPAPAAATVLRFPASGDSPTTHERKTAGPSPFRDFQPRHRQPLGTQLPARLPAAEPSRGVAGPWAGRGGAAVDVATGLPPAGVEPIARPAIRPRPPVGAAGAPAATAFPAPLEGLASGEWPHHQPDARLLDDAAAALEAAPRRLAFVLHAHLPWVLGHGIWPHGEDWLAEAVTHCYLPLIGALRRLAARGGRHLLTVSISPVLAAQLADPRARPLVEAYLEHRRAAARALAPRHPLAGWWQSTYEGLTTLWEELDGDLVGALAALAASDVIELSTCAVTHGYLPLLHRREHLALQLLAARHNHRRWFGSEPLGLWMPECAYRPAGPWQHPSTGATEPDRPGNETFLAAAGVRWTVVDAHLLLGGEPLAPYPELWGMGEDGEEGEHQPPPLPVVARLQPRQIAESPVMALPREPHSAHQVWSRHGGYPGDPRYLDFHKRHAETGLRLWRVTDAGGDLGDKLPYHPGEAMDAVRDQARHFPQMLAGIAGLGGGVAVAPYDAELFGHWWFEGVAWLEELLGNCLAGGTIELTTPARELAHHPPQAHVSLHEGSWGEEGDHRVWVNAKTAWMWEDVRRAEEAVHRALPTLPPARARAALAQLLLLAASDWPFLVTTGTASDYAAARFSRHRDRLHELLADPGSPTLPDWVAEDLAGVELDPAWWEGEIAPA